MLIARLRTSCGKHDGSRYSRSQHEDRDRKKYFEKLNTVDGAGRILSCIVNSVSVC